MRYAHGTYAAYTLDRCRCEPCTVVNRAYKRRQYRRCNASVYFVRHVGGGYWIVLRRDNRTMQFRSKDQAETRRVCQEMNETAAELGETPDPYWATGGLRKAAVQYLQQLQRAGIGYKRVAQVARVGPTRLGTLLGFHHPKNRPQRQRLKWSTAQQILGVQMVDLAAGARIPATHTWRLIDELRAAGIPKSRLASAILGRRVPALQLNKTTVVKRNADRVQALHDRLLETYPPLRAHCQCREPNRKTP